VSRHEVDVQLHGLCPTPIPGNRFNRIDLVRTTVLRSNLDMLRVFKPRCLFKTSSDVHQNLSHNRVRQPGYGIFARHVCGIMHFHTLHPFFCVRTVTIYSTSNHDVPIIRHTPLHTCTPMKFVFPSLSFLSNAPAIGAPISDAILDTLHDMPSRVPNRERSGVMLANAADGTVTRAAEKNPTEQS
jgi:hypothetical protein